MVLSDVTRAVCHVERNLRCLQEMPRVGLTNIKDFRGAQKKVNQSHYFQICQDI